MEFSVQRKGFECLCQIFEVQFATHAVSETISPVTPLKPNFDAAMAAAVSNQRADHQSAESRKDV